MNKHEWSSACLASMPADTDPEYRIDAALIENAHSFSASRRRSRNSFHGNSRTQSSAALDFETCSPHIYL